MLLKIFEYIGNIISSKEKEIYTYYPYENYRNTLKVLKEREEQLLKQEQESVNNGLCPYCKQSYNEEGYTIQ